MYERFCRFAFANPFNAKGPCVVAVVYEKIKADGIRNLTAEQFEKETRGWFFYFFGNQSHLQCYLRFHKGDDLVYHVIGNKDIKEEGSTERLGTVNDKENLNANKTQFQVFQIENTIETGDDKIEEVFRSIQDELETLVKNYSAHWSGTLIQN